MEQLFSDIAEDLGVKTKDDDETCFHPYGECQLLLKIILSHKLASIHVSCSALTAHLEKSHVLQGAR
jgi:hypothetical protein